MSVGARACYEEGAPRLYGFLEKSHHSEVVGKQTEHCLTTRVVPMEALREASEWSRLTQKCQNANRIYTEDSCSEILRSGAKQ